MTGEAPIRDRIEMLVEEEHRLREEHAGEALAPDRLERLRAVEAELDQCWAHLRRRRAGQPEGVRDEDVPWPANDLDGPEPEPPHLEHGVHGDGAAPDPGISPNAP